MARLFTHAPEKAPVELVDSERHDSDELIVDEGDLSEEEEERVEGTLYAYFYGGRIENVSTLKIKFNTYLNRIRSPSLAKANPQRRENGQIPEDRQTLMQQRSRKKAPMLELNEANTRGTHVQQIGGEKTRPGLLENMLGTFVGSSRVLSSNGLAGSKTIIPL